MNDKRQLEAMGEHIAGQPLCMAKRIEELEAQVRVMVGLLRESIPYVEESADAAPSKQIAGYHETLVAHMKEALAGKLPVPVALHALSQEAKESLQAMVDYCLRNGIAIGVDEGFKTYEPERKHPFRIELESFCAMLAAAPKPDPKP